LCFWEREGVAHCFADAQTQKKGYTKGGKEVEVIVPGWVIPKGVPDSDSGMWQ
jgi:hypothetical protein